MRCPNLTAWLPKGAPPSRRGRDTYDRLMRSALMCRKQWANAFAACLFRIVAATSPQGARSTGGLTLRIRPEEQAPVSLLKTEPPAPVASLPELFAIAHALEEEAASRYTTLAAE